jgi:DUF3040 family protein
MTKQEREQLRQIERALAADDPRLAMVMSGGTYQRSVRRAARRRRLLLVTIDLLALVTIVAAAASGLLVLIFLGSLVTLLALCLHVVGKRVRTV